MSTLSKIFKKIILWLLGDGRIEFLLDLARKVVQRLENHDDLDSETKREKAKEEIREKLKHLGKNFSSHMINLAIEMALIEFREQLD
ncbi:hypothetical protein KKB99_07860 [bacterium]|nr:hypothetical protein [bacterium]MBU1025907.1 hypothetical protein [bacterium]